MFKLSKVLVVGAALALVVGCSSDVDDAVNNALEKDSVALSELDQNIVVYKNAVGGVEHTDVYCQDNALGDKDGSDGRWEVTGNDLTVNPSTGVAYTYITTSAKLEKDKQYGTSTGETFTVTKISDTVCL